jgi:hypothetical protein
MVGVEFKASISGVIHMERVVRRLHAADEGSVRELAEKVKGTTVTHLYSVWKEQSGAAGRSVQVRNVGPDGSGGWTAQVGSFYDAGNFQRGINHFVLLEGGFTLRNGQFRKGGHSLGFAAQLHAGVLPRSWQRIWSSGAR